MLQQNAFAAKQLADMIAQAVTVGHGDGSVPIRPSESIAGASAKDEVKAGTGLPVSEDVADDSCYFRG